MSQPSLPPDCPDDPDDDQEPHSDAAQRGGDPPEEGAPEDASGRADGQEDAGGDSEDPGPTGSLQEGGLDARQLFDAFLSELRGIASRALRGHTHDLLQPTALINEAFLRLTRARTRFVDKQHFLRAVAKTMFSVLTDYYRRRPRTSGGDAVVHHAFDDLIHSIEQQTGSRMDEIEHALDKLERLDTDWAQLVRLRFFLGMTVAEAAQMLEISVSTAEQSWTLIKKFLHRELGA